MSEIDTSGEKRLNEMIGNVEKIELYPTAPINARCHTLNKKSTNLALSRPEDSHFNVVLNNKNSNP